jgi:hypothetical protein
MAMSDIAFRSRGIAMPERDFVLPPFCIHP